MTEGSEWKLILLFTLPLMAGNFLQQLYNAVDGIVVGNFAAAGENALRTHYHAVYRRGYGDEYWLLYPDCPASRGQAV